MHPLVAILTQPGLAIVRQVWWDLGMTGVSLWMLKRTCPFALFDMKLANGITSRVRDVIMTAGIVDIFGRMSSACFAAPGATTDILSEIDMIPTLAFLFKTAGFSSGPCHAVVRELFLRQSPLPQSYFRRLSKQYLFSRGCCGSPLEAVDFTLAWFVPSDEDLFNLAHEVMNADRPDVFEHVVSLITHYPITSILCERVVQRKKPRMLGALLRRCRENFATWYERQNGEDRQSIDALLAKDVV